MSTEEKKHVTFVVEGRKLAMDIDHVQEILNAPEERSIARGCMKRGALFSLRNKETVPLIPMADALGIDKSEAVSTDHVMVCLVKGQKVGFLIGDVMSVSPYKVEEPDLGIIDNTRVIREGDEIIQAIDPAQVLDLFKKKC